MCHPPRDVDAPVSRSLRVSLNDTAAVLLRHLFTDLQAVNPARSIYIDAMRFVAAMLVVLFHLLGPPYFSGYVALPAREAVVVFFVISGFVIAYVADTKEREWRSYVASRMARLYSVVLPAIVLTAVLYAIGSRLTAGIYEDYSYPWARLLVSLLFMNQSWNLTVASLNNGPFWSLCYEFWYYVVFGAAIFARYPWNIAGVVLAAAVAGPRIALLFPLWLIGAITYSICKRRSPPNSVVGRTLFLVALGYLFHLAWSGTPFGPLSSRFANHLVDGYLVLSGGYRVFIGGDWRFPDDFFLGLWVALTIYLVPAWSGFRAIPAWPVKTIRFLASFTFSLYLYHAPLLVFLYAISLRYLGTPLEWQWLLVLVLCAVLVLGAGTEHATGPYRRVFSRILGRRSRTTTAAAAHSSPGQL